MSSSLLARRLVGLDPVGLLKPLGRPTVWVEKILLEQKELFLSLVYGENDFL